MSVTLAQIKESICKAVSTLFIKDSDLMEIDVNERAITHRLAIYIEKQFPDWNVDCEYNRYYNTVKQIKDNDNPCKADTNSDDYKSVYPDIIVHRRKLDDNLLVIEFKKKNNPVKDDCDLYKLQRYKTDLKYKFAVFIRLDITSRPSMEGINKMLKFI